MITDSSRFPDCRWQAAVRRAGNAPTNGARPDGLILRTVSYLKARRDARTGSARAGLDEKCSTIATARDIRFGRPDGRPDGRRNAIEVRVLAGYPPGYVAKLKALDPAVVWVYVALFFDVLDRLKAVDFVATQVIGPPHPGTDVAVRERKAMRWLAWIGGPLVAEAPLLPGRTCPFPERPEGVGDFLQEAAASVIARAAALAPWLEHLDVELVRHLTRLQTGAWHDHRAGVSGDAGVRDYVTNVTAYLEEIKLCVGRKGIPDGDRAKYHKGHAEPRAHEWVAISRGDPVPELDARLSGASPRQA